MSLCTALSVSAQEICNNGIDDDGDGIIDFDDGECECASKQQTIMEDFVEEYNTIRPHESLNMKTPSEIHVLSNRQYSANLQRIWT